MVAAVVAVQVVALPRGAVERGDSLRRSRDWAQAAITSRTGARQRYVHTNWREDGEVEAWKVETGLYLRGSSSNHFESLARDNDALLP